MKFLEEISNKIDKSINDLKKIFEKMNEDKEKLKMDVTKIFTKIRSHLNEREDEILLEIDDKFNNLYFKEELFNQSEKLPNNIKINANDIKWSKTNYNEINNDKLNFRINDCLEIENNIQNIKKINESIQKCNSKKSIVKFVPQNERELDEFLKTIKIFGKINEEDLSNVFEFRFKPGKNYTISNYGLIATKTGGGNYWNCSIIGDKEIPKDKISKWKIKINNFELKINTWNILIGIGPDNPNNQNNFHRNCWNYICGNCKLSLKSGKETDYNNNFEKLKKGDIVEVIVDRKLGTLSFSINDFNCGIAYSKIPNEDILYPVINIFDENQMVEIVV